MYAKVMGKVQAARSLSEFMRYFKNWREVWSAYRDKKPLPPLVLKNGITLFHDETRDDPIHLFREIFRDDSYNNHRNGFYRPAPGDLVLDLGANIGFFSLSLQWRAGGGVHIHCYEPSGETFARLSRNVTENGLGEIMTLHHSAVSDRDGTVVLKQADLSTHRSLFANRFEDRSPTAVHEEVSCVSLDTAVAGCGDGIQGIDLLKVDVEGAEIEVFEGAHPDTWTRIQRVVAEYHDQYRPGCLERITRVLSTHGFTSIDTLPDPCNDGQLGIVLARR